MNGLRTLCFTFLLSGALGQSASPTELLEPWDPVSIEGKSKERGRPQEGTLVVAARWLIGFYQRKLSTRSISRCPFYTSCSVFAKEAIRRRGAFLGISMFIDRYYFREHSHSFAYYGLRTRIDGKLKLDDHFFLDGKDQFTESMR